MTSNQDLPNPKPNINIPPHPVYSGKIIKIKEEYLKENPSRNTKLRGEGWKAWNLILSKGGSISYTEYRKLGGEIKHLDWELCIGVHKDRQGEPVTLELIDETEYNSGNKVSGTTSQGEPPLNQILYGPPGTGKTYTTKDRAVKIITGRDLSNDRHALNKEYKELCKEGRIEFVTFHQSYGYEEFVEGIKPKLDKNDGRGDIRYEIKSGIFKKICERARNRCQIKDALYTDNDIEDNQGKKVWWITLKNDFDLIQDCLDNDSILFAAKRKPYKGIGNLEDPLEYQKMLEVQGQENRMKNFYHGMQEGDAFVISTKKGNKNICAAGILGDYKYDESQDVFKHTRQVKEWYLKDGDIDISDITSDAKLTKDMIIIKTEIQYNDLLNKLSLIDSNRDGNEENYNSYKNYVLIIDEINRGNISKILGELITLIEEDKRDGADEALEVTLPYSQDPFSVPKNLYIIGTMNTADRSIAFLDTALRRRFQFKEITPQPEILSPNVEGVNLQELLRSINNKICELLDRDHRIGHSYFMGDKVNGIDDLADVFKNSICPLLDEYFYDRRKIIDEVLNGSILIKEVDNNWEWNDDAFNKLESYKQIYSRNKEE